MLRMLQVERDVGIPERLRSLARSALRPCALAGTMFLLMRFEFLLRAAPLAPALLAAGLAAGESPGALVAGCLLGMLRLPLSEISLLPAISCALVLAAELALSLLPAARRWTAESRISLVAGLSALLPAIISANADLPDSARALAGALLAASAAPFFMPVLELRPGRTRLTLQEKTGSALLACGCLAAVNHLFPPAAQAFAVLLVLLIPKMNGASGVAAGLALCFGGGGMVQMASLALCAFASGLDFIRLRWQRALAVCIAAAAVHMAAGGAAVNALWALCAAAAYMLLPEKLVRAADSLFSPAQLLSCSPEKIARETTIETRRRLRALGDAFAAMAEGCAAPSDVLDEQELICRMRSRLCTGCAGYEACWAGADNRAVRLLCSLITDSLDRLDAPPGMRVLFSDGEIPPDVLRACRRGRMIPDRLGLLLRDFAEKRRSEIKRCADDRILHMQFMQAGALLHELAENQSGASRLSPARQEQLQAALQEAGLPGCRVSSIGYEPLELRVARTRQDWSRDEIQTARRVLCRSLGCRFVPLLRPDALHFTCAPRLSPDTGTSCQSGIAGEICGDSHMVRMMDGSRLLLALSDGMGCGEAAANESLEALRLLWCFLDAGISRQLALETVNRQLLVKSTGDIFATMDLCIIDLNTGIAEISKLAACRTLVLRGRQLMRIEGGQLPLGILEGVQPGVHRLRLRPGDMLIMGSDGVMEAGDALMIERIARENAKDSAQQLAERLVREAGLRRSTGRADDLTCICVRMA